MDWDWVRFWHDERDVQFFFEPEACVVGVAEVMREPACLAMVIMKSWTSLRFTSAMLVVFVVLLDGFCYEERGLRFGALVQNAEAVLCCIASKRQSHLNAPRWGSSGMVYAGSATWGNGELERMALRCLP